MFEDKWCQQAKQTLQAAHPEWADDVLDEKLHTIFNVRVRDPKCMLTNNYRNVSTRTTLMTIYNILLKGNCVLGGDGCIFVQHETQLSLLAVWIKKLLKERKELKNMRDTFDKGTPEWIKYDLAQNNKKIMINSLYGILGYMRFHLFNVNLAQSTTAMGQAIISTATCHFENFIDDNIKFVNITELTIYINNICNDFHKHYESNKALFKHIPYKSPKEVAERLSDKVGFDITSDEAMLVSRILANMDPECLKMIYYMNNLSEFLEVPYIKSLNLELLNSIHILRIGDISTFDNLGKEWNPTRCSADSKSMLLELIKHIQIFVLYKHQVFDRVRRTRYTNKRAVLYIDTDSNFISTNKYVIYAYQLDGLRVDDRTEVTFKAVNIFTMILTMSIAEVYWDFAKARNINDEYAAMLGMKNEFYYPIIMFGKAKKRYIGLIRLQEGKLVNGINKQRLVAGFDFKKAGTKDTVREKCYDIIDNRILLTDHINSRDILMEVRNYEKEIRERLQNNDASFYKQLTVQPASRYKSPLSNQGYKSVHIWNAFNPLGEVAFPIEVDIIPITLDTGMTRKKYYALREDPEAFFESKMSHNTGPLKDFYHKHRDIFNNYYDNILRSPNECEWALTLSSIAKPREMTEMPEWLIDIIDVNKITTDIIKLLNPIIEPLGPVTQKLTPTAQHYTNIVDI